jgi:eukaryotic-like serine/threonine-protein kinase
MSVKKFLTSFTFFKNLFLAILLVVGLIVLFVMLLDFKTNHGEEIKVPNLSKLSLENAEEKLDEIGLETELLDTIDFNPEFPPYSIVEQDPKPNSKVKDGRKIYVKINAGGFTMVTLPNLQNKTFREVANTLRAIGLIEGEITYKPDVAKDVVLEMKCNGKIIKAGDKITKNSKIDFVLGDGKDVFLEEEQDTIKKEEENLQEIPKDSIE